MTATSVRDGCLEEIRVILPQPESYSDIAAGKPLLLSAGIDSIAMVELVLRLENRFSVEIDSQNLEDVFFNIDSLARFIDDKRSNA